MKFLLLSLLASSVAFGNQQAYTIVSSAATKADPAWNAVVDALQKKHPEAKRIVWENDVTACLPELTRQHPRYVCFVSPPSEVSLEFVRKVHRLTRKFDADPFTDCRWGILTGFDSSNALEIASEGKPLIIRHTVSGTELATERCESVQTFDELVAGKRVMKQAGEDAVMGSGPVDSSWDIAIALERPETGLLITSGHATERGWEIGYRYKNGTWKSKGGGLFAVNLKGESRAIHSPSPKVYLPIGNCLMGHIDGLDAMALAFMKSAGVCQMAGYTLPTWYGYQGWGLIDYFVEQPGRYSLTDAFFANQNALIQRLLTFFPEIAGEESDSPMGRIAKPIPVSETAKSAGLNAQDAQGLLFDRDVVAFYGDPAWQAHLVEGPMQWKETWSQDATGGSLEITPQAGASSFSPINTNGSQRGGRPIVRFFENRIDPNSVRITEGAEFNPVITDDFLLVPIPSIGTGPIKIVFAAKAVK